MEFEPLRGSCSCGRNEYQINIPEDARDNAKVYFDGNRDNCEFIHPVTLCRSPD